MIYKMPPVGKLSSVLAQFEQTIEQNNAAGVASGMYLTKLASSSKDVPTKSRSRSNNTLSTSSSHSSKKSANEHSSRNSRSSVGHDRKENRSSHKRPEQKPLPDKKDWNTYLEKTTNKSSLLRDDDSSVSEISQDSFGFDEVVPFEDPFKQNGGPPEDFNPFGLDEMPQPSDSSRKQRPMKEKRGIGRLGNRTTKAKLDVKAAKRASSKEKTMDGNDEESQTVNNNDDDDDDDDDIEDESVESGMKSNNTSGRHGRAVSTSTGTRANVQRGESFKRNKSADVDRHSSHGSKYSPDRRQKEKRATNNEPDDSYSEDGFSLTYVAKRDGARGTVQREESFNSRKSNKKTSDARISSSMHNRTSSLIDRNQRTNNNSSTRNTSPIRRSEGSSHGGKSKYSNGDKSSSASITSSSGRSRKDGDMELNPERLSPQRQVKSFRDSSNKTKSLHSRSLLAVDRYDNYETRSFRDHSNDDRHDTGSDDHNLLYLSSESTQPPRKSSTMHTRKLPNTLDPSSAQSRFFGGNGESKIKVRTKPNVTSSTASTSGTSVSRASQPPTEKRSSSNGRTKNDSHHHNTSRKHSNMDRSDHSKQSHVSNASISAESLVSESHSKVSSSHHRPSSKSMHQRSTSHTNHGTMSSSQHTRTNKLQMIKKIPSTTSSHPNNSSSQLNYS